MVYVYSSTMGAVWLPGLETGRGLLCGLDGARVSCQDGDVGVETTGAAPLLVVSVLFRMDETVRRQNSTK